MGYRDKLPPKPLVQFYAAAPVHILSAVDTLKYESEVMAAPTVVAKGVDDVAKRIREVAEEHGIPIMANPPLARALHAMVEVDREIPIEHYKAVAEIIGYVMGPERPRHEPPSGALTRQRMSPARMRNS